jgi:hypothetical protein
MSRALLLRSSLSLVLLPAALIAQDNDPPGRVGRISSLLGTVAFQSAGSNDWSTAPLNYTVTSGDRLFTGRNARAEMEVGPFAVRVADSTDLRVERLTDDFAHLGLARGTMRVTVYRLSPRDSMEIDTPNGAMIIRSAGRYRVDVVEGASTIVTVEEGRMELSGPGLEYTLTSGRTAELTGSNPVQAILASRPATTEFDRWSGERDYRQERSDCSRYVSRDIPGCADLSDHGRWDRHVEYGYVWRPTRVVVGWTPYRYGRWVWSGPWGWTWVEDSPWGFAPFHYGRWVVVGGFWAWAPGPIIHRPYYAPALVVFVGGNHYGRRHHAWFPLGWHEPYYPRYRHSDRYLRNVNIANVRNVRNVDEFVDPRRADRIKYANRQATTVVETESFERSRPVATNVANVRPEDLANEPTDRTPWRPRQAFMPVVPASPVTETPDVGVRRRPTVFSQPTPRTTDPDESPRTAEPRDEEPRGRTGLVRRNVPLTDDRRATATSPSPSPSPAGEVTEPRGMRRPLITRQPSQSDQTPASQPTQRSRRTAEPVADQPERTSPRERPVPERTSSPRRESSPAEPSPRESAPRESAPRQSTPRESAPRSSSPRESAPRTRAPSAPPSRARPATTSRRGESG